MSYEFKTKPFGHQLKAFDEVKEAKAFAVFWEQGTGKTKFTVDNFAYLFENGEIDCVLILAPNGVHRNWVTKELPVHLPDRVAAKAFAFTYYAAKSGTKTGKAQQERAVKHPGLTIVSMTFDAFVTKAGKEFAWKLFTRRKVFYILDEAARIKSPSAKRTKSILASAKYSKYRRILTGTPVANSPFDVYTLMKFLDEGFWKPHGVDSFLAFKTRYGKWIKGYNQQQGREFEQLIGFQRLDELQNVLAPVSTRVLKEDVLDLPPKLYNVRYFELSTEQRRVYEALKEEYMAEVNGEMITAPLAIVRLLRFQQVCSGYVPREEDESFHEIEGGNPRLDALEDLCTDLPHSAIIWSRFRKDIDKICSLLSNKAVRYDGSVSAKLQAEAVDRFQSGDVQFFVANPAAAGEGLTLHTAKTVIYYNNSFKLTERLQSEDRAHRAGMDSHPVNYIDLVAQESVDEYIVESLQRKINVASQVTGDRLKTWLSLKSPEEADTGIFDMESYEKAFADMMEFSK